MTEQRRDLAEMHKENRAERARKPQKCQYKGKCVVAVDRGSQHHNDRSRGDQQERQQGEHVTGSHGSSPDCRELVYSVCEQAEHGLRVKAQPEQQSHHHAQQQSFANHQIRQLPRWLLGP